MTVRLYDEPPHANLDPMAMEAKEKGRAKDASFYFMKNCRDDDLILLTSQKLNLQGRSDIKQAGGVEFILDILSKPGSMLAFVK